MDRAGVWLEGQAEWVEQRMWMEGRERLHGRTEDRSWLDAADRRVPASRRNLPPASRFKPASSPLRDPLRPTEAKPSPDSR